MDRRQTLATYDEEYARTYDERFVLPGHYRLKTEFEVGWLRRLLHEGWRWLDVACGTGYFLSRFPEVPRGGLDLSPAMLERARAANPDAIELRQGDFTDDFPDWAGAWDLVTCMWYAYGMVDSPASVARVIENLAAWTSPRGTCFVPVFDPHKLTGVRLPYLHRRVAFPPGTVKLTGVTWTWIEESGKEHRDMVAPATPEMVAMFHRHFELVPYPPFRRWGRQRHVRAIVARRKREA